MNVVMTGAGELVEVQATGEGVPFSRASLDELLGLAAKGIAELRERPGGGGRGAGALTARRVRCGAPCASCSRAATRTSCASSAACWLRTPLEPLPDWASSCRPRTARPSPTTR